jgi:CRP-like cAMP-binding protein
MSTAVPYSDPRANRLLACLSPAVLKRLAPMLRPVSCDLGDVLIAAGQPVNQVYFPTSGLYSLLTITGEGSAVEAAVVGREGMLGEGVLLGRACATFEALCQGEGHLLMLPAETLLTLLDTEAEMRATALRYVALLLLTTARNVACNRLHPTPQRLARWLLQVQDSTHSDILHLTHEFLGQMLGVRRPTVTEATAVLEDGGLVRHRRGRIRVLDRAGLEAAACEDYAVILSAQAELLGSD